jgi:hypothetical protein
MIETIKDLETVGPTTFAAIGRQLSMIAALADF